MYVKYTERWTSPKLCIVHMDFSANSLGTRRIFISIHIWNVALDQPLD
uniref:Uncharacterized protein n=1 Tax=Arundo donax TaxID=35708 RepID=A0A0A9C9D0_ARUDO